MTSTSTYQGLNTGAKPSSRVLAAPGGGSSNIFGTPPPVKPAPAKETLPAEPAQSQPAPSQNQNATERSIRSAPKQAYNPITGEPIESPKAKPQQEAAVTEDKAEEVKDKEESKENAISSEKSTKPTFGAEAVKPSTRVSNPPGGKCSGPLW